MWRRIENSGPWRWVVLIFLLAPWVRGDDYERLLYEKILPALFHREPVVIYAEGDLASSLRGSRKLRLEENCKEASVILTDKGTDELPPACRKKPIFATSYRRYKQHTESIGAFYWRKGRPQLRFRIESLRRFGLSLPKSLEKFAQ